MLSIGKLAQIVDGEKSYSTAIQNTLDGKALQYALTKTSP